MTNQPAARIGERWDDIDSPALVVDLDALESNLRRMAQAARAAGVRLRPHAKTHRCSAIARAQIALGAVGVCCQTVGEAEAMVSGGVDDVLVSNQLVGARKLERLAALATRARVAACVDDAGQVEALEAAAGSFGSRLRILVEIDVGGGRCGVATAQEAVSLAERVAASPHLIFGGLQGYHGRAQHLRAHAERRDAIAAAVSKARDAVALLSRHGLACDVVSGAGTGSFAFEAASGVFNEIQAGSYVFMDADYAANQNAVGANEDAFAHSLFVKARVISLRADGRAIVDAGLKSMSAESGLPRVVGAQASTLGIADEHTTLRYESDPPAMGASVRLIPGHCDPTVNLHDWLIGLRSDRVEAVWKIDARGASI